MKKFSSSFGKLGVVVGGVALASSSAMAAPITVDLADATTSVTNAGTAVIGVAVVILTFGIVYGFLRNRG